MENHSITIINQKGESRTLNFVPYSYRNLMEFILHELYEDIGACKGKAWCGTCHGAILQGVCDDEMFGEEVKTLGKLETVPESRLACQIMLEPELDGMVFKIIGDG